MTVEFEAQFSDNVMSNDLHERGGERDGQAEGGFGHVTPVARR